MLADKPTELSRIKLKTWTRQPVPMISEHSAHLTPLSVDFRTWLWRYTYLLLLISMLWQRQAIFLSKGDKLCSSAECRIWTRAPCAKSPADWMLADKPTELSRIKLKTWTRQPVPMISEHSAHLTPLSVDFRTWLWRYTYLLLLFRCSGTGKRYSNRKETSCVPLLNVGFEPGTPDTKSPREWMLADKPAELPRIKLKTWTRQPVPMISEHSAHLAQLSVTYIHKYIHTYMFVVVNFDALAQASDIQIERRQVVFLCWMQDLKPGPQTPNRQQTECSLTNRLSYRGSS